MKKVLTSLLFLLFFFIPGWCRDIQVVEIKGDTLVAIPIRHLPTINGVFEENLWLKREVCLRDSLSQIDSLILRNRDLQLESWKRQEAQWRTELGRERAQGRKLVLYTGIGGTLLGILIGLLVK